MSLDVEEAKRVESERVLLCRGEPNRQNLQKENTNVKFIYPIRKVNLKFLEGGKAIIDLFILSTLHLFIIYIPFLGFLNTIFL